MLKTETYFCNCYQIHCYAECLVLSFIVYNSDCLLVHKVVGILITYLFVQRLTGHKAVTQNVKVCCSYDYYIHVMHCGMLCLCIQDALGTLGGVQVLFPLLETVDMPIEPCQEPGITASNEQGRAAENMHKIENTAKVLEDSVGVKNARDFSTSDSYCSDVPSSPVTEEQTNQIDGSLNEAVSDSNENTKVIKQLHWKPPSSNKYRVNNIYSV